MSGLAFNGLAHFCCPGDTDEVACPAVESIAMPSLITRRATRQQYSPVFGICLICAIISGGTRTCILNASFSTIRKYSLRSKPPHIRSGQNPVEAASSILIHITFAN
ncbi:unnamed protein product [Protopolystoma xenopodis]|uniref:Uncharacterized protein n=1 Tax=Protopolystoma xenopodis TaxID=117903 RepID=A0A448WY08_9PLAT|nr:unnamed protein product [Protopolystoma xenopodis]